MTAFTVADHLANRLAELNGDNVFGAPVDHRQGL
ncbi:TPP-dependent 2-oxoacid decarboxylase [Geodermatophilus bullaregiensis]|nr:TPP-dependent 2-oxoacid decarboxylase [Geodermatophilus bullaregiensis]